jgi:hypothetical protein
VSIERVGQLPADDKAAEPVEDRHQVHESIHQRHIGDVSSPQFTSSVKVHNTLESGVQMSVAWERGPLGRPPGLHDSRH